MNLFLRRLLAGPFLAILLAIPIVIVAILMVLFILYGLLIMLFDWLGDFNIIDYTKTQGSDW